MLIDLSAIVGLDGVPLHFQLFPKLWLDIYSSRCDNRHVLMKSFFLLKTRPGDLINQVLNAGISSEAHWQRASHCSSTPMVSSSTSTPSSLMRGPASTTSKLMKMIIRTCWSYLLNWFQHLTFVCPGTFSSSSSSSSPRSPIKSSQSRSRNMTLIMFWGKSEMMVVEMSVTVTKIKMKKTCPGEVADPPALQKLDRSCSGLRPIQTEPGSSVKNLLSSFCLHLTCFLAVPPDFQN